MIWPLTRRFEWRNWNPWADLRQIQHEMNRVFEGVDFRRRVDFPALNVWHGENESVVTAEIPGIDIKDLDISVRGNTLVMRGERAPDKTEEDDRYRRQERGHGEFVRSLQLPHQVNAEKVKAIYSKGILRISLPVAETGKPKQISVKVK